MAPLGSDSSNSVQFNSNQRTCVQDSFFCWPTAAEQQTQAKTGRVFKGSNALIVVSGLLAGWVIAVIVAVCIDWSSLVCIFGICNGLIRLIEFIPSLLG